MPKLASIRDHLTCRRDVGRLAEFRAHLLHQRAGSGERGLWENEHELIAAVATHDVAGSRVLIEQVRHLAEDDISDGVAVPCR